MIQEVEILEYNKKDAQYELYQKNEGIIKIIGVKSKYDSWDRIFNKKQFRFVFKVKLKKPIAICKECGCRIYENLAYYQTKKVCSSCFNKLRLN